MTRNSLLLPSAIIIALNLRVFAQSPELANPQVTDGQFTFQIEGALTNDWMVQVSDGTLTAWTNLAPVTANSFTAPAVWNSAYFRLRSGPDSEPVYSVNAAGYQELLLPPRFSILGYSLVTRSNLLSEILGQVPEGSLVFKFSAAQQAFAEVIQYVGGRWSNPAATIGRGEAVIFWNPVPTNLPLIVVGMLAVPGPQTLGYGWHLISPTSPGGSPLPQGPMCGGGFDATVLALMPGSSVSEIDPGAYQTYYQLPGGFWDPDAPPFPPFGGLWFERCPAGSPSGGFVNFNNRVPGFQIDAPLADSNGVLLAGTNWLAQLYGGTNGAAEPNLVAVGEPLPFLTGEQAGYLDTGTGSVRAIPDVPGFSNAVVQIRFWDARTGTSYETAAVRGQSPVAITPTRPAPYFPPPPLLGLRAPVLGATLNAGSGSFRLHVRGFAGMTYAIDSSANLTNWTSIATVTNRLPEAEFVDAYAGTEGAKFYRARILGPAE